MSRFGYINTVNLIGVGDCNNPFYDDPDLKNRIPLLDNGSTDLIYPFRSGFGNHAFAIFGETVFDACSGPSLGKPVLQYLTDTIDTSTPAEQNVAGNSTYVKEHAIGLK